MRLNLKTTSFFLIKLFAIYPDVGCNFARKSLKIFQNLKLKKDLEWVLFLSLFIFAQIFSKNSYATVLGNFGKEAKSDLPAILKADRVDGDQVTKTLTATGNVEVSKGSSVIYADEMVYDKDNKKIRALGNVKVKNIEIGNVLATRVEMKDDFKSGKFYDSRIFFNDGHFYYYARANGAAV